MASWTDGPEYAPAQRPDAFAAPATTPLDDAAPQVDLSAGAPSFAPTSFEEPRDRVPALASLVPILDPGRDPHQPFVATSAVITAGSAWGSAHSAATVAAPNWQPGGGPAWAANQPYASAYPPPSAPNQFPAPGTPQWFGPGAEWAPPAAPVPATLTNAAKAASIGMLIVLAVGGIVTLLAPFLLAVGWALTSQVRYRRKQVRTAFAIALGVALTSGVLPILGDRGIDGVFETVGLVALLGCWVMLVTVTFLQYTALAAGERPEPN